jgi:histidyl-tRNA synthetase
VGAVSERIRVPKGTHDLFPAASERFAAVEDAARRVFGSFGYAEIRTPIFESTDLFARSVGDTTDIVHKEMYTFADRKGRSLTLRPENTAGVVRALVEKGLQDMARPIRLWYAGPQFRYEQPQAGRYREFRQIGLELVGVPSAAGDAEVLIVLFRFLAALGLTDLIATLNCIPAGEARQAFSRALQEHVRPHLARVGAEDRRRFDQNPLRLFDSKDPEVRGILEGAPATLDFLDDASRAHHEELKRLLAAAGVRFVESPSIVRGLDYYTLTVFEVASERLGAQNAILGGGRYDHLIRDLGGPPTPAVGFAIGEDRLVDALPGDVRAPRSVFFVIPATEAEYPYALSLADEIRDSTEGAVVETDLSGRGLVRGLSRAGQVLEGGAAAEYPFRAHSVLAVLVGSREREEGSVTLKDLATKSQESFPRSELAERLGAARQR